MKQLLKSILTRLEEIEDLKYVDEDWGQFNDVSDLPVKFPCALVDISLEGVELGLSVQCLKVNLNVTLAVTRLNSSSRRFSENENYRNKAFEAYDIINLISKKLHHWQPNNSACSEIVRTGIRLQGAHNGMKLYSIEFNFDWYDDLSNTESLTTIQTLDIEV